MTGGEISETTEASEIDRNDQPNLNSDFTDDFHSQFHKSIVKPLSENERAEWLKKIWISKDLPSHAQEDDIKLLFWYAKQGERRANSEVTIRHTKERDVPGKDPFCGGCQVAVDRKLENEADGIIFNTGKMFSYLKGKGYCPVTTTNTLERANGKSDEAIFPNQDKRDKEQFYIFYQRESGTKGHEHSSLMTEEIDGMFNLTVSYRTDSDAVRRFGMIEESIQFARFDGKNIEYSDEEYFRRLMDKKTKKHLAAWFVSNCDHTEGAVKRWEYGESLMNAGLRLYGEGECFGKVTERSFSKEKKKTKKFTLDNVKFYLAFENAYHCNDYISEKFWRNGFHSETVPVVFGPHPDDVMKVAPPNSFIHSEWFTSPAQLVSYLEWLDRNDDAYLDYHQWRTLLLPQSEGENYVHSIFNLGVDELGYCMLCRKIREMRSAKLHQSYKSVMKFWHYDLYDECKENIEFQPFQTSIRQNKRSWKSL
ncbi:unnamed protein product [Oikopleura dioica]|uniref:Fucosyltransferase n=1 Tax=Oikopleura dioica TaxID=34765 RepID=E4XA49_OIKDI|nr:unnamed protein product [Oikopleura dioica]